MAKKCQKRLKVQVLKNCPESFIWGERPVLLAGPMVMHWSSEIYRRHVLQVVVVDPSLRFWFSGLKYKAVLELGNSKDAHLEILSCHPLSLRISTQNGLLLLLLLQGKRERLPTTTYPANFASNRKSSSSPFPPNGSLFILFPLFSNSKTTSRI